MKERKKCIIIFLFSKDVVNELEHIKTTLKAEEKYTQILSKYHADYVAIKLLERDSWFQETVLKESAVDFRGFAEDTIQKMEEKYDNDIETILAEQRYGVVNGILKQTLSTSLKSRLDFTEKFG